MARRRITAAFFKVVAALAILAVPRWSAGQQALEDLERQLRQPAPSSTNPNPLRGPVPQPSASRPVPALELPPPSVAPTPSGSTIAAADEPGYLGVFAVDVAPPSRGVLLDRVVEGGPAATAGLQRGDLVTSIDGKAVQSNGDLATVLAGRKAGEQLAFVVLRGNEAPRIDVVLGRRPPADQRLFPNFGRIEPPATATPGTIDLTTPGASPQPLIAPPPNDSTTGRALMPPPTTRSAVVLGVRTVRVTPELQLSLNLPEPKGALVVEVFPDTPAAAAGIPVDAVIVAAQSKRVESPADLAAMVESVGAEGELRLSYYRFGQLFERTVRLAPAAGAATPAPAVVVPPPPGPPRRESVTAAEAEQIRAEIQALEARLEELKKLLPPSP